MKTCHEFEKKNSIMVKMMVLNGKSPVYTMSILICIKQLTICHGRQPLYPNKIKSKLFFLNPLFSTQYPGFSFYVRENKMRGG